MLYLRRDGVVTMETQRELNTIAYSGPPLEIAPTEKLVPQTEGCQLISGLSGRVGNK